MIYEEVLVVGKVFYTPTDHDRRNGDRCEDHLLFKPPELQLLRVCRQIHFEAEPIYLAKNLFVFPVDWFEHFPFVHEDDYPQKPPRFLFSEAGLSLIKNVSLGIDACAFRQGEAYTTLDHDYWITLRSQSSYAPFTELSPRERLEECHGWAMYHMEEWDSCVQSAFHRFQNRMEYLELDFTNAFCFFGDCRPLGVFDIAGWLHILRPSTLVVRGLYSGTEREEFNTNARQWGTSYKEMLHKHGLRFVKPREQSQWDAYKMGAPVLKPILKFVVQPLQL